MSVTSDTIDKALGELLLAGVTLDTLVNGRIYPHIATQGDAMPFVVYGATEGEEYRHMTGTTGCFRETFNIEITDRDMINCRAIHDAVLAAIDGYRGTIDYVFIEGIFFRGLSSGYDPDGRGRGENIYTYVTSYEIFYQIIDGS